MSNFESAWNQSCTRVDGQKLEHKKFKNRRWSCCWSHRRPDEANCNIHKLTDLNTLSINNPRWKSSFLNTCRRYAPFKKLESVVNILLRQLLGNFANTAQTLSKSQALDVTRWDYQTLSNSSVQVLWLNVLHWNSPRLLVVSFATSQPPGKFSDIFKTSHPSRILPWDLKD